jgi:hypothetical protein
MGRLVAQTCTLDWEQLTAAHGGLLMEGPGVMGAWNGHVHVLQRRGLAGAPGPHRGLPAGAVRQQPSLIRGNCRSRPARGGSGFCQGARCRRAVLNRFPVPDWVHHQVYLHPYPKQLVLRNHV